MLSAGCEGDPAEDLARPRLLQCHELIERLLAAVPVAATPTPTAAALAVVHRQLGCGDLVGDRNELCGIGLAARDRAGLRGDRIDRHSAVAIDLAGQVAQARGVGRHPIARYL